MTSPARELSGFAASYAAGSYGMRNRIINGGFDVWQRGTSQTSNAYASADRWFFGNTGSSKTVSRQEFALGQSDVEGDPRYFMRHAVTSVAGAANFAYFYQRIEGVRSLAGGKAAISFWAKADATKQIAINIGQVFGTGGSPSAAAFATAQKVTLTTAWQRFAVVMDVPSLSGKTVGTNGDDSLQVEFWMDAGSNFNSRSDTLGQQSGTFDFANIQVEAGSVATPFERRPYATEEQLCQRYCYVMRTGASSTFGRFGFGIANSSTNGYPTVTFPTTMRAAPTISTTAWSGLALWTGSSLITPTNVGVDQSTPNNVSINVTVAGGLTTNAPVGFVANGSADAAVQFLAEL